ncbi:hypothetical protein ACTXT7_015214 [Hymenolepis weldensis]
MNTIHLHFVDVWDQNTTKMTKISLLTAKKALGAACVRILRRVIGRHPNPNIMADGESIRASRDNSSKTAPESNCKWPHSLPMTYWEEFNEKTESYLTLDIDRISVARKPRSRPCKYWNRWFPALMQHAENISGSCPRKK